MKRPKTSKIKNNNNNNKKIGFISQSDFERIKNTIDPNENNINNNNPRKLYEQRLKSASNYHKNRFGTYNKSLKEKEKELFIKRELAQRKIDEINEMENKKEKDFYSNLAKEKIFKSKDEIRSFQSSLMLSDALNERKFQNNIKNDKKKIENEIEKKYHLEMIENMKKFDEKEKEKNENLMKKKIETMKMIKNQINESKIKKLKEKEEKEIEGLILKKNYLIEMEKEKKKNEELKLNQKKKREEFIKNNENIKKLKEEKKKKRIFIRKKN